MTHPSQQPQLLLMAPWSGHSVHKWSQPFLSFERLTSTFFEMRNSVSIKIGKKQSINQSINQSESSHQSLGFWSSLYIVVVCLIPRSAINHVAACKQLSAMSWSMPRNPMQWHWPILLGIDIGFKIPWAPAIFALLATHHHGYQKDRKRNRPQAEDHNDLLNDCKAAATLPPNASWMRQFASIFLFALT